jgi:hypothetical protein
MSDENSRLHDSPRGSVTPDMPVNQVARVLLESTESAQRRSSMNARTNRDDQRGDLIREMIGREARRDWWLTARRG